MLHLQLWLLCVFGIGLELQLGHGCVAAQLFKPLVCHAIASAAIALADADDLNRDRAGIAG